jgi:tetratricopeptide (TPR) repeat protein
LLKDQWFRWEMKKVAPFLFVAAVLVGCNSRQLTADECFRIGAAEQEFGNLPAAIAYYSRAIALKRNFPSAYYSRATAEQALHNLDAATADYGEAIAREPNHLLAYLGRGRIKLAQRDFSGAFADADQRYESTQGSPPAM